MIIVGGIYVCYIGVQHCYDLRRYLSNGEILKSIRALQGEHTGCLGGERFRKNMGKK